MGKVWRVVRTLLVLVVVLIVGAAGAAWYVARSSLPTYGASLTVGGLLDEVTIYRDEYGVPHIFAKNLNDAFFAQGYVHAQDRLWEMDLSRRAVQGRLSEIFGESYLEADKFLRTVGFYRAAEDSIPIYPPDIATMGEAYAAGVNAFIAQADKLPLEFTILGYRPDPWTVTDSAAIGKYMCWVLGGNLKTELLNLALVDKLGLEKTSELFPVYPEDGPIMSVVPFTGFDETAGLRGAMGLGRAVAEAPARDAAGRFTAAPEVVARLLDVVEKASLGLGPADSLGLGSNNWVVAGRHAATGKPLLANDMHLEIKQPSIWYQNHLVAEGLLNVTGVMFPGCPGVIVGHNERVAWGVTNTGPDVQDLYIERPNPDNPYQFEYDGVWEPAAVYREEIRVKGQDVPVEFEVLVTRHGPIITEVMAPSRKDAGEDEADGEGQEDGEDEGPSLPPLSLRWTALDPTCELMAVLGFDTARNWDDFRAALEWFECPAQNFVFADVDGNIAYRSNGRIPVRSEAHVRAGCGLVPVPGWSSAYEWVSYIPWDELPSLLNPPAGIVVTANHRVPADDYPYFISASWAPPYRAASIWQELYGRTGLTAQDMQAIQMDNKNLHAARLAGVLTAAIGGSAGSLSTREKAAWDILAEWLASGPEDLASSPAPTIFHTLFREAIRATFLDELGEELYDRYMGAGSPSNTLDAMLLAGESPWFDDVTTAGTVETVSDVLLRAFQSTVAKLTDQLGGDPASWEWGKVHTVTFDHPMGSVAALRPFFNLGPFPTDGSGTTACAKGFGTGSFEVQSGAPWRFVADLADLDHCYDVVAVGISGQPFSPHYADQMELWLTGGYKVMRYDRAEIEALEEVQVTVLRPGQ